MTSGLRIEYVPLAELRRWPRNPKQHDLGAIHQSVARFGFVNPIIVNEASGLILAGHGRLDTLLQRQASSEPLPQGLRSENGQWLVPVVMGVSLSSEEAEAYAIADNRIGELGGWDEARLAEVLSDLAAMPAGLEGVGYDGDDLDQLLRDLRAPDTREDNPNIVSKADELQEKWQVERGQVWRYGPHRVMCGDATSDADVARLMAGQKAVLLATDPPYGDAWVQKAQDMAAQGYGHSRAVLHDYIEADDKTEAELAVFLGSWLQAARVAGDPPFPIYVWHRAKRMLFEQALLDAGYHVHQPVIWVKPSFVIGRLHYHPRCEWALHGWLRGGGKCAFYGEQNQSDVWEFGRENDGVHPTQKPLGLFETPIKNHCRIGEIVYDPFLGSGTTLIAAEKLGRICYGMEIAEKYVSVCLQRYQEFTGDTPRLADG